MRIKSYFAPSVQNAIGLARQEFGDEVTLVTSHLAAPEARHLGEYEVVFAIEEPGDSPMPLAATAVPEPAAPPFTAFQTVLLDAVTKKALQRDVAGQLESVRATLIELGIEPAMVRALMTLIEKSIDASAAPEYAEDTGAMLSTLADSLAIEPAPTAAEEVIKSPATPAAATAPAQPEPQRPKLTPAELAFVLSVTEICEPVRA